ncbi:MAG: type transport system permease protein [Frankiaceae bacterium]|nr:type transport system permease protein [Frankiaceae bacterium]
MTTTSVAPRKRAKGIGLITHQLRYEQLAYWRNPPAAFFTFLFPLMFLVLFASLNKGQTIELNGKKLSYNQYFVPGILAYGVMGACFSNLAMTLSNRREFGQLKRKRATPLPAWALIGGLIASSIVISLVLVIVTFGAGIGLYGVVISASRIPAIAVALILGAACFCAVGIALQTLIPNADAAPAVVNFTLLPLTFISGVWFPVPDSSFLAKVAEAFPVRHFVTALFDATNGPGSGGFATKDLLWLAGWLVLGTVVAVRRFRWEPGRR